MNDFDKIRNEQITEDEKLELIADYLENGGGSVGINVVELEGLSGTLSDEQYDKITKNNCMIMLSTQYFYKQYSAATVIKYGALPRVTANHGVVFESIDIDKTTKAYEYKYEEYAPGE